jgi:tRNA G18 (ribose-2'-O)-methylase SpoU
LLSVDEAMDCAMNRHIIPIDSPDDPRIADYRLLKERELAAGGGKFIAEGELVARRLLESDYPVESVLLAEQHVERITPLVGPGAAIYAAPAGLVEAIVGYKFHLGVLACGRRKPPAALDALAAAWPEDVTLVILPEVTKLDNLGALLRVSSAFGAAAVILGPRCCDPFYRKSLRVSMGAAFSLPLYRSADLAGDLARLRQQWGVELVATVLDADAQPLDEVRPARRTGLLLGNEGFGLRPGDVAICDRKVCIPMKLGTDSLNVAVAAAVFLYHFTRPQTGGAAPGSR